MTESLKQTSELARDELMVYRATWREGGLVRTEW